MFKSAKITDRFGFAKPKEFDFIFPEREEIDGHELIHVGSGVYVFKENILFDHNNPQKKIIDELMVNNPDISFIVYERWPNWIKDLPAESVSGIAFVVSKVQGLYYGEILNVMLRDGSLEDYFHIPESNRWFIDDYRRYLEDDEKNPDFYERLSEADTYCLLDKKKAEGKLRFEFQPEKYGTTEDGHCPFILLDHKVGYYIGKDIYSFKGVYDIPFVKDYLARDSVEKTDDYHILRDRLRRDPRLPFVSLGSVSDGGDMYFAGRGVFG
ncbi:MAG: hypothetical protein IJ661_03010 [Lachnospiraceae bacterium]|nr:hypothetical protein [Lachnospiraceae bacterium]